MLALGLVPIFVLSLFFLFSRGLRLQKQADDLTRASETARLQLEAIRQFPYGRLPAAGVFDGRLGTPRNGDGFPPAPYPSFDQDGRTYTVRVEVAPGAARGVRVDVFWSGNHSTMLETLLNP